MFYQGPFKTAPGDKLTNFKLNSERTFLLPKPKICFTFWICFRKWNKLLIKAWSTCFHFLRCLQRPFCQKTHTHKSKIWTHSFHYNVFWQKAVKDMEGREEKRGKVVIHVSGPHSHCAKARHKQDTSSCCLGRARELSVNETTDTSVMILSTEATVCLKLLHMGLISPGSQWSPSQPRSLLA